MAGARGGACKGAGLHDWKLFRVSRRSCGRSVRSFGLLHVCQVCCGLCPAVCCTLDASLISAQHAALESCACSMPNTGMAVAAAFSPIALPECGRALILNACPPGTYEEDMLPSGILSGHVTLGHA